MAHIRKLGALSVFAASTTFALFGCKKEAFQSPGATQQELNRDGLGMTYDQRGAGGHFLGLPASEQPPEQAKPAEPEAVGGGPRDESIETKQPPSGERSNDDDALDIRANEQ